MKHIKHWKTPKLMKEYDKDEATFQVTDVSKLLSHLGRYEVKANDEIVR